MPQRYLVSSWLAAIVATSPPARRSLLSWGPRRIPGPAAVPAELRELRELRGTSPNDRSSVPVQPGAWAIPSSSPGAGRFCGTAAAPISADHPHRPVPPLRESGPDPSRVAIQGEAIGGPEAEILDEPGSVRYGPGDRENDGRDGPVQGEETIPFVPLDGARGTNRQEMEGCVAQRVGATRNARGPTRLHRCGAREERPAHLSWKIPSPFQPSLRRGIHGEGTMPGSPAWNCSAWTLTR